MVERVRSEKVLWINLKNPTEDEVREVVAECKIPPGLSHDLLAPVPRNYALADDGIIKVAMDFPVVKRIDAAHPYELKFLIGKHVLITVQYEEMEGVDRFKKEFEVLTTLKKTSKNLTGTHLFFALMGELYITAALKLDYLESILSDMEAEIFRDNEKQMVVHIARTSKRLIAFRHTLRLHEDVFFDLEPLIEQVHKQDHHTDVTSLKRSYFLLLHRTNTHFETLSALREANNALLNTRQNEIMKILTIMAFITFPLTLFSSMFGMNTESSPIIGQPHDFWIIVSIMTGVSIIFLSFFRFKKWI